MKRRTLLLTSSAIVGIGIALWFVVSMFRLSALQQPGKIETYLAARAKHWLVARSARRPLPPEPANDERSTTYGKSLYGGECCEMYYGSCASCHGADGLNPTKAGLSMYPPTPGLGSADVQRYTNAELFVIIKEGIRFTAMSGFSQIHSDEGIWHLVHYVRSLQSEGNFDTQPMGATAGGRGSGAMPGT